MTDLASAIKQIFPTVPLKYIIRKVSIEHGLTFRAFLTKNFSIFQVEIQPPERETIFSDELRPSDPRNVGPCGGFSTQYFCMCDFHGVPYR